jgi:hypothetical protein
MNKKSLYIIIVVLVLIVAGGLLFFGNKNTQKETGAVQPTTTSPLTATQAPADDQTMVDCGTAQNPLCFINRMNGCLPVTVKMTGTDKSDIVLTIFGIENNTCHFQRKINGVVDLNCFFPKGTMNTDTISQTFGDDKGLQKVVDAACKKGW